MKKSTFAELLADVAVLEEKLATPTAFYWDRLEPYHQTARAIARRILIPQKPENHDSQRWESKVELVISHISAHLILTEGAGMVLTIVPPKTSLGNLSPKNNRPGFEIINHSDVVEWIRAGDAGVVGGKRITPRDRKVMADAGGGEKGEYALATIVMRAYYSHKPVAAYVRLRRAIQKYLNGSEEDTGDKFLDSVATAWIEHFSIRFPRDMKQYVGKLCRDF